MRLRAVAGLAFALALAVGASASEDPRVIKVTAKKFEFTPSEIHVKLGEHVVLELTSLDRKHGFKLPELKIRTEVPAGETTRVDLTAEKPGRFPFACDVFCGDGHEDMTGTLVVDP